MKIIKHVARVLLVVSITTVLTGFGASLWAANPGDIELDHLSESRSIYLAPYVMAVDGDTMFRADYESGVLFATDVTDPANQSLLSIATMDYMFRIDYLEVVGNYAYISGLTSESDDTLSIVVVDVSNPADMQQVAVFDDTSSGCVSTDTVMYAAEGALFVDNECDNVIQAINIDDPINMYFDGSFSYSSYVSSLPSYLHRSEAIEYSIDGLYIYLPGDYLYVKVDISDSSNLSLIEDVDTSALATAGPVRGVVTVGDYVYFKETGTSDLVTIDVSNPATPTIVSRDEVGTSSSDCDNAGYSGIYIVTNQSLYIMCNSAASLDGFGTAIIDISNPASPVIGPSGGVITSDVALVYDSKLYSMGEPDIARSEVYDLSNPTLAPQLLGFTINDFFQAYITYPLLTDASADTMLLVNESYPVIRTVDISDPADMTPTGTFALTDAGAVLQPYGLTGDPQLSDSGDYLYLSEGDIFDQDFPGNLTMVDISDLTDISLVERVAPTGNRRIVASRVVDDIWYVVTRDAGGSYLATYQIDEVAQSISLLDQEALIEDSSGSESRYVEVLNGTAFVFHEDINDEVEILDVTNPAAIGTSAISAITFPAAGGNISNPLAVGSNHILVPTGGNVHAIDVSTPAAISVASSVSSSVISQSGGTSREALTQNYANPNQVVFKRADGDGFAKIDVTDPDNMSISDETPLVFYNGSNTYQSLFPVANDGFDNLWETTIFNGDIAYGVSGIADSQTYSVNAADLSNPLPLDVLSPLVPLYNALSIAFNGDYALVGGVDYYENNTELSVFDITDTSAPEFVGGPVHDFTHVLDIEVKGGYAYANRYSNDLTVFDLTNPTFPLQISGAYRGFNRSYAYDLDIDGDYIYVADDTHGLVVHDISTPTVAPEIASYNDANFSGLRSLEVDGQYVYAVSNSDDVLMVLDISDPADPATVSTISEPFFDELDDVRLSGDRLYVTGLGSNNGANFAVYDVSDATSPQLLGSYVGPTDRAYEDVEVVGDFALVAASDAGAIDIIDLEDETNPQLLKSEAAGTLQGVNELALRGDQLFTVASVANSMNVYDITLADTSDPADPDDPSDPGDPADPTDPDSPANPDTPIVELTELARTGLSNLPLMMVVLGLISYGLIRSVQRQFETHWSRYG